MIVVVGHPRTGTSWVMQILRELGVSVIGSAYRNGFDIKHNPKGYWEDERWLSGEKDPSLFSNEFAAKINLRMAVENKVNLFGSIVLLCDRNRKESAKSQQKVFNKCSIERICNHDKRWHDLFIELAIPFTKIDFEITEEEKVKLTREAIS